MSSETPHQTPEGPIKCHLCGQDVLRVRRFGRANQLFFVDAIADSEAYRIVGGKNLAWPIAIKGGLYREHQCGPH